MFATEKYSLNQLNIDEIVTSIDDGLKKLFEYCHVTLEECPDLTKPPFNLAASGLCGHPSIADIGSVSNLAPVPDRKKIYTFEHIAHIVTDGINMNNCFMIGAGAGPFHKVGNNCELMPNILMHKNGDHFEVANNNTYYADIFENNYRLLKCEHTEFGLMSNLFISEGKPGKVIKIVVEKRLGKENFTESIQKILREKFPKIPISLGGVFIIEKGKAKLHIMPDFSPEPLPSSESVDKWLRYFDMDPPLICLTTFHSEDPGLDLRMEHTHCFSDHNQGGHYHYDTTPDIIRMTAYLNVAEAIYRIDRPTKK
ncbi:ester hydrolase C11orf54 homolog [Dermatophagoides pteronyssinus]|uniref:ester hydrolase C11orf54 homolog n=1 Tax=Dermatophagoides pteronyssinus TaxID=6956 RepID=UPI003F67676C